MSKPLYGYLSQTALDMGKGFIERFPPPPDRAAIYSTPNGSEVMITGVGLDPSPSRGGYQFADAVCVGQVVKYLRGVA